MYNIVTFIRESLIACGEYESVLYIYYTDVLVCPLTFSCALGKLNDDFTEMRSFYDK